MSKHIKKSDLPTKVCATCGRPFAWRKKWAKEWENVRYCSDRCRGKRSVSAVHIAICLIAFFVSVVPAYSVLSPRMQRRVDSLRISAEKADATTFQRASNYGQLAWIIRDDNPAKGLEYARLAIQNAEYIHNDSLKLLFTGYLGILHRKMGNYPEALMLFYDQFVLAEHLHDLSQLGYAQNNLCDVYKYFGNHAKAIEYGVKAKEIFEQLHDTVGIAYVAVRLAQTHQGIGQYDKAIALLNYALDLRMKLRDTNGISSAMVLLSHAYLLGDNVQKADEYAQGALILAQGLDSDRSLYYSSVLAQARVFQKRVMYNNAADRAQFVADSTLEYGFRQIHIEALQLLIENPLVHKDPARLVKIQKQFIMMRDSAFQESSIQKSLTIENEYNFRRTAEQLRQLQAEKEVSQRIATGIAVALLILLGALVLAVRSNIKVRRAERALHTQREATLALNSKLKETNAELNGANGELSKANQFKIQLLGMAAHDLRTPLTGILGLSSLIKDGETDCDDAKIFAEQIHQSGTRMVKLIKDLLESTSMELQNISLALATINLRDHVEDVVDEYRAMAAQKRQDIRFSALGDCMVRADKDRLYQAVENLLSNAIKYSGQDSAIEVRVARFDGVAQEEEEDEQILQHRIPMPLVRLEVRDHGQGLTQEDLLSMFGMFQRLSAQPTGGESSTGIGLFIVQHVVKLHGGVVWAESAGKDKGATFIVELPAFDQEYIFV